jgi:hypothetical protein
MFAKTLIAAAAVAASLTAALPAEQAQAKTNIDLNIGIGGGYGYGDGYGYGHYPYPHRRPYYDGISCRRGADIVQWNGFWGVSPVDCSLPRYHYSAWRHGQQFMVTVNGGGTIINVRPIY